VNLVDSSAWLEFFADGPNASHFAPVVVDAASLVVPTVIIYEVYKAVLREAGESAALQAHAALAKGKIVDLTSRSALEAAQLSIEYELPMADAIILASARADDAVIWTQDSHFRKIPGVRFFPKK
jgi:toxin FitB